MTYAASYRCGIIFKKLNFFIESSRALILTARLAACSVAILFVTQLGLQNSGRASCFSNSVIYDKGISCYEPLNKYCIIQYFVLYVL